MLLYRSTGDLFSFSLLIATTIVANLCRDAVCLSQKYGIGKNIFEVSNKESALSVFPHRKPPYLAVLTEPDATEETSAPILELMMRDHLVDIISIRVNQPNAIHLKETNHPANSSSPDGRHEYDNSKIVRQQIEALALRIGTFRKENNIPCCIVINDVANIDIALKCGDLIQGLHVKEKDMIHIATVRQKLMHGKYEANISSESASAVKKIIPVLVGTSVHSIESAVNAAECGADYMFVGTCFLTESHPEKTNADDLEGPLLPGLVRKNLNDLGYSHIPCIAIGGINAENCNLPIEHGADGVACIRSLLKDPKPPTIAAFMNNKIQKAYTNRTKKS